MYCEIGSDYWRNTQNIQIKNQKFAVEQIISYQYRDSAFLSSGRQALGLILNNIQATTALLPIYTCETVIRPFIDRGYKVDFYDIEKSLHLNRESFLAKYRKNPNVILVHAYFGFDTLSSIKEELKNTTAIIIEDVTHNLFSKMSPIKADYRFGSFRKWCAIPDGAFATSSTRLLVGKPECENERLIQLKREAFYEKYLYMEHNKGDKNTFLEAYRLAENEIGDSIKLYNMSSLSNQLLCELDYDELKSRRIENYNVLLQFTKGLTRTRPVFSTLQSTDVPLYFPVYHPQRSFLQRYLCDANVYAPVIWPVPSVCKGIETVSMNIYDNLLAIPCDQRYGIMEMERIGKLLEKAEVLFGLS